MGDWEWGIGNGVSEIEVWEWDFGNGVSEHSPPLLYPQLDVGTIYSAPGTESIGVALGDTG